MTAATLLPDDQKLQELEEKFDPEMRFRPTMPPATQIVKWLLIALSAFHYYTAGFGLLQEITHRGVHLAFVLGMIFLVFAFSASSADREVKSSILNPGGVPLVDWLLAGACALSVLYIPYVFDDLMFRVGNPSNMDVIMGSILFISLLEATRRSMGWPLPLIAIGFTAYALLGPYFPGLLKHAGANWSMMINHQYLTSQGIYGVAVGVVATYVFHFVLFGVMATRIGLGQLFLDLASSLAGRYAGGPAKVSVFGSALFGMLSGSSVANAVTVGSLTIPAMIRVGYKKHFAAAVEAASSTGGQITPPVLGAAASTKPSLQHRWCQLSCTSLASSCKCTSKPNDMACAASLMMRCRAWSNRSKCAGLHSFLWLCSSAFWSRDVRLTWRLSWASAPVPLWACPPKSVAIS
ncbi:MAG: Sialic acid transporter permease protein SiaT [Pseudomonadota bacterium]